MRKFIAPLPAYKATIKAANMDAVDTLKFCLKVDAARVALTASVIDILLSLGYKVTPLTTGNNYQSITSFAIEDDNIPLHIISLIHSFGF